MTASISLVRDANYYFCSDYYSTNDQEGVWHGAGSQALGYEGVVTNDALENAFLGLAPDGMASLVQVQADRPRQQAWDVTLSAPKSLSSLWSVLGPSGQRSIENLMMKATKRTADYLLDEALWTRRGRGGARVEQAQGLVALFPHTTSRALDPQLHCHCLFINLCHRLVDDTTGTIRSIDLYKHKMAAGAIFRLELATLLRRELGLTIQQDGWSFMIAGVPEDLCRLQSKRRAAIERRASKGAWSSPQEMDAIALATRAAKQNVPFEQCVQTWRAEGVQCGFTTSHAERLVAAEVPATPKEQGGANREDVRRNVKDAVSALAAVQAYFPARDIVRTAAANAACNVSVDELLIAVHEETASFEHLVRLADSPYGHYSTRENIHAEKELIQRAEAGRHATSHLVKEGVLARSVQVIEAKLSRRHGVTLKLTADQRSSIQHITTDPGSTKVIQGSAGTGKTQLLEAASHAWKASGYQVIGAAISGKAAMGLEQATGIRSFTIESLLRRLKPNLSTSEAVDLFAWKVASAVKATYYEGIRAGAWMRNPFKQALRESLHHAVGQLTGKTKSQLSQLKLTSRSVLVVDEAAMLPTKALLAIKQECDAVDAKLVLVGDRLQLPPIEAGGPFWSLANRLGHSSLTTVVRQKQPWMREAVSNLIDNEPLKALECYAQNDAVHLAKSSQGARMKLVHDYARLRSQADFEKAIAIATTNSEVREINGGVQAMRQMKGQLGRDSLKLANGERAYVGDRVMVVKNDYKLGVRNGLIGTVIGVHRPRGIMGPGAITIAIAQEPRSGLLVANPQTITIDLAKLPQVQLAYAATTAKLQGVTVEKSFVLLSDSMLSKEHLFTQLTRASQAIAIYASESQHDGALEHIAQRASRSAAKDLAIDHSILLQKELSREKSLEL